MSVRQFTARMMAGSAVAAAGTFAYVAYSIGQSSGGSLLLLAVGAFVGASVLTVYSGVVWVLAVLFERG